MKRFVFCFIAILFVLVGTSSTLYKPPSPPDPMSIRDPCVNWSIYEMAEYATGAPREIIEGLHFAESSKGKNINHPDINDSGDFGLNKKYQAEREKKHGKFNSRNPHDAAIEAGLIYMDNLHAFHNVDAAISAYNRGINGTIKLGIKWSYVNMVKRGFPKHGK